MTILKKQISQFNITEANQKWAKWENNKYKNWNRQAIAVAAVIIIEQNNTDQTVSAPYQHQQQMHQPPIHGERCSPETDSQLFPIVDSFSSDKFLYCHQRKRVYDVGSCTDKMTLFDPSKRKCLTKVGEEADNVAATVPTRLKIFAKDTKQQKIASSSQPMVRQRMRAFFPANSETGGVGTDLKIQMENVSMKAKQTEDAKLAFLEQNDAESLEETRNDGSDTKVLIKLRTNSSETLDKDGNRDQFDQGLPEAMVFKNVGDGKLSVEEDNERKLRQLVVCSDGSLPFGDNNGRSHRCIPDYGHNPFSSFACPFSYQCEYSSVLRAHQCCPQLIDANREPSFDEEYSELDGEEMPDGAERTAAAAEILDFSHACPPAHFLRVHPKNGHPTLCSPGWLILAGQGGCPPFSKCVYSAALLQFVCCQPNNLLKAMENEMMKGQQRSSSFYPPRGIHPAQSGCIGHRQCDLKFPGAKCRNWVCICPTGLSAYDGRCVPNCPYGHSDSNGICTPAAFDKNRQKYLVFWRQKR
ncbi:hypothetical protein GPALN_005203 [Globodera pallida]|nr:hypothetical protein GPALN_005203 [Globodera pallida]